MASRKAQKEAARERRLQREQQAAAAQQRRSRLLIAAIVGAVVLAAAALALVLSNTGSSSNGLKGVAATKALLAGYPQHGATIGSPTAPVTLQMYGDLQCPICKEFTQTALPDLLRTWVKPGLVKLQYMQFPILGLASNFAANASVAASRQNAGWTFNEIFYRNQGIENTGYVTTAFLNSVAKASSLNMAQFTRDRESIAARQAVKADTARANAQGFNSTPSFVVIGPRGQQKFSGQLPQPADFVRLFRQVGGK